MKKILSLIIVMLLLVSLVACGKQEIVTSVDFEDVDKGLAFSEDEGGDKQPEKVIELSNMVMDALETLGIEVIKDAQVYASASNDASVIGYAAEGTIIDAYYKIEEDWCAVNYNGRIAYVLTVCLSDDADLLDDIAEDDSQSTGTTGTGSTGTGNSSTGTGGNSNHGTGGSTGGTGGSSSGTGNNSGGTGNTGGSAGGTDGSTTPDEGGTEGGSGGNTSGNEGETGNPGEGGNEGGTENPGEGGTGTPGEGGNEGGTETPGEGGNGGGAETPGEGGDGGGTEGPGDGGDEGGNGGE